MRSFGLTLARILPIVIALVAGPAFTAWLPPDDELATFEQSEGEQVVFRFWVLVDAVKHLFPEGISPAAPRRNPAFSAPPGGFVEGSFVFRLGSYVFEREGRRISRKGVIDGFLLIAAEVPAAMNPEGAQTALLAEYYCNDAELASLMRENGLRVGTLEGAFDSRLRADSQQLVEGKVKPEGYGEWRWRLVTTDLRHYETAASALRAFYKTAGELRALEIRYSDDFFMMAYGDVVFDGKAPPDGWEGWRWAGDRHSLYQYNTRNRHVILCVRPGAGDQR